MIEWIRDLIIGSPTYTAYVEGGGVISSIDARYQRGEDGAKVSINFSEAIRDGNNINHLNVRDPETGEVMTQYELRTGETGLEFSSNIDSSATYDLVFVDRDGNAVSDQEVSIERH